MHEDMCNASWYSVNEYAFTPRVELSGRIRAIIRESTTHTMTPPINIYCLGNLYITVHTLVVCARAKHGGFKLLIDEFRVWGQLSDGSEIFIDSLPNSLQ